MCAKTYLIVSYTSTAMATDQILCDTLSEIVDALRRWNSEESSNFKQDVRSRIDVLAVKKFCDVQTERVSAAHDLFEFVCKATASSVATPELERAQHIPQLHSTPSSIGRQKAEKAKFLFSSERKNTIHQIANNNAQQAVLLSERNSLWNACTSIDRIDGRKNWNRLSSLPSCSNTRAFLAHVQTAKNMDFSERPPFIYSFCSTHPTVMSTTQFLICGNYAVLKSERKLIPSNLTLGRTCCT